MTRTRVLILALLALAAAGCRMVDETVSLPGKAVTALVSSRQPPPVDPADLQSRLLRFTDDLTALSVDGIDTYARLEGTRDAQLQALRWKLAATSAAIGIASGSSPYANLIDLASTTTLTAILLEERVTQPGGASFEPWLRRQRSLETNVWTLATSVFGPEQEQELRAAITRWLELNPELRLAFFVRPIESSHPLASASRSKDRNTSVFGMIGLDPVAGLDPAVREVTRSRLLAERAMYVLQRMPFLVRWQTEVLANDLTARPEVSRALTNLAEASQGIDRLGRAAESASRTAADLPGHLAHERAAILEALENQQGRLRELAATLTTTLGAGDRMSSSLNTTILTFDALMKRFGVGEPDVARPTNNPSPPFRVLDYAETADRLAVAARELDTLFKDLAATLDSPALERRTRDLESAASRLQADTRALLNHAFRLAAALVLLVFACTLLARRLGRARPAPAPPQSGPA